MYIRSIELKDLRAFSKARLEFLYPGRKLAKDPFEDPERAELAQPRFGNVNIVLGVNGSGKSTVLDAIALALLSPVPQNGFVPNALIRRSNHGQLTKAIVTLELVLHSVDANQSTKNHTWEDVFHCTVKRQGDYEFLEGPPSSDTRFSQLFMDRSPAFLLLGYGVFRRVESLSKSELLSSRQKRRSERYDRVASLFEDDVALIPLSSWFPSIRKGPRRDEIVRLINKVTPRTVKFAGKLGSDGEMVFAYRNIELPFSALSDGYRGHLGWIGDLLCRLNEVAPSSMKLTEIPGVVLVDEIDAHLHPAWQQEIIGALAKAFPKLQFIVTTHSPLITGTVERANVNVVTRSGIGFPKVTAPEKEMYGLSSDQILTTGLFGLESSRDSEFQKKLSELKFAASRGDPAANVKFLSYASIGYAAKELTTEENLDLPDWLKETSSL